MFDLIFLHVIHSFISRFIELHITFESIIFEMGIDFSTVHALFGVCQIYVAPFVEKENKEKETTFCSYHAYAVAALHLLNTTAQTVNYNFSLCTYFE